MNNELEKIGFTGVNKDPRTVQDKLQDYTHHEFIGGSVPYWTVKTNWITLSKRNQVSSSSCGGQAFAKASEAFYKDIASALPIYESRSNFPSPGMYMQEIGSLGVKIGTGKESDYPSQNMTEDALTLAKRLFTGMPYKIASYYNIPTGADLNMDLIAQALDKGHAIVFGIESNANEWIDVPIYTGTTTTFSHFITSVPPNYLLKNGEKSVVIDDSCNAYSTIEGKGQRILTESFLKKRCWGILALVPVVNTTVTRYSFKNVLTYGMKNNVDVLHLQDCLKSKGFFPKEVDSTGNFLQLTAQSIVKYQVSKGIMDFADTKDLSQIRVGLKTLAVLNKDFS